MFLIATFSLLPLCCSTYQTNRQYKFVRDQFEVVPKKDLLIHEGFIAPPKGHELELTDIENAADPTHSTPPPVGVEEKHTAPGQSGKKKKKDNQSNKDNKQSSSVAESAPSGENQPPTQSKKSKPSSKAKPRPGSASKVQPIEE